MAKRAEPPTRKAVPVAGRSKPAVVTPLVPKAEKKSVKVETKPPSAPEEPVPEDLQAVFGENLKAARLKSGLKQSDLAERTGLTQERLSRIENGRQNITLKTMMRLAAVVGWNVSGMLLSRGRRIKE